MADSGHPLTAASGGGVVVAPWMSVSMADSGHPLTAADMTGKTTSQANKGFNGRFRPSLPRLSPASTRPMQIAPARPFPCPIPAIPSPRRLGDDYIDFTQPNGKVSMADSGHPLTAAPLMRRSRSHWRPTRVSMADSGHPL